MINQTEVDLIRKEMLHLKDCITKYVGYVLAGSGAAVYGIARMDVLNNNGFSVGMSFVSFIISVIISFITVILFYKFHSHNRFAGYCKVLSHEKLVFPKEVELTFAWEMAVARLRRLDSDPEKMKKLVDRLRNSDDNNTKLFDRISDRVVSHPNKWRFFGGLRTLARALSGEVVTDSWAFPPFVASICFILSLGFFCAGHYLAFSKGLPISSLVSVAVLTTIFQIILWWRLIRKLDDLMNGCQTVDSFFWKFIPIRTSYLSSFGIIPEYLDTDD